MRDIFEDIFKGNPLDPMEAARRNMRPDLRKRFYERAGVEQGEDGFRVLLDGRAVRTPARRELAAPSRAVAQAIAAEWAAQTDVIDPARMPLTRLANSVIDGVAGQIEAVVADVAKYLGSDLLFYRAGEPEGLVKTVFDADTGELLGAHMIGAEVTELIQGYTVGKQLETTEAELMQTVFPHPTLSEMMHESVLAAYGRALHI